MNLSNACFVLFFLGPALLHHSSAQVVDDGLVASECCDPPSSGLASDDFDCASFDIAPWTKDDGAAVSNTAITIPGSGTLIIDLEAGFPTTDLYNDPSKWPPLVYQTAANSDFEVEVKFATFPSKNGFFEDHGIFVRSVDGKFLRFSSYSDSQDKFFYGFITPNGGVAGSSPLNPPSAPDRMKVKRSGDDWVWSVAYPGDTSFTVIKGPFTQTIAAGTIEVGLYAAATDELVPWVAEFEYFHVGCPNQPNVFDPPVCEGTDRCEDILCE